ncbi:hypothetical protein GS631_23265, partial [Escherichia coli]|nr:hypothetical protein [Escherichia coli]EFH7886062.1 hypothetical protein [Escherichia coli]
MTDFGGKTSIFSHPVYLFLREFSLQDSRGGSHTRKGERGTINIVNGTPIHERSRNIDNRRSL